MAVLGQFSPRQTIYSIDECFLDLSGFAGLDPTATGQAVRRRVDRGLGLPVAVGIGPTPTLAKLANHLAKQEPAWAGVCDWGALDPPAQDARLAGLDVAETWGIGPGWGARLRADGMATIRDLRAADPATLGRRYGVVVARIVWELRGLPVPGAGADRPAEAGNPRLAVVRPAGGRPGRIAGGSRAPRGPGRRETARPGQSDPGRAGGAAPAAGRATTAPAPVAGLVRLAGPTADAARLTQAAVRAVAALVEPGRGYAGAGVRLLDLSPVAQAQTDWVAASDDDRTAARRAVLDQINARWGRGTLRLAREGFVQPWAMRQDYRSPAYTTRWDDLPVVRAE